MKKIFLISFYFLISLIKAQDLTFYVFLPAFNQTGRISKKWNYNFFISTTVDAFDEKIGGIEYPATDSTAICSAECNLCFF